MFSVVANVGFALARVDYPHLPMLRDRDEDEVLGEGALVVRGGTMQLEALVKSATKCLRLHKVCGISVYASSVLELKELCELADPLPQPQIRLSTVGRIVRAVPEASFRPTFDKPHYTLVLPKCDPGTLTELRGAFDDPTPNPSLAESQVS